MGSLPNKIAQEDKEMTDAEILAVRRKRWLMQRRVQCATAMV